MLEAVIVCDLFVYAQGYVCPSCSVPDVLCRAPTKSVSCAATAFLFYFFMLSLYYLFVVVRRRTLRC